MSSRFSEIAHEGLLLWNPLPEKETLRIVDGLPLAAGGRVLDVGCGRAELLLRLLERTGGSGVGVDTWGPSILAARASRTSRVADGRLELREEPFDAARFADGAFDVALCVGSTHAAGGFRATLRTFRRLLRAGGTALVGEGHWLTEPDPAYIAFLGGTRDELADLEGNLAAVRDVGFDVIETLATARADFDAYEDRYAANVERFVAEHRDDPDADAFLRRIRAWRAAYLRWGRDTLGFALHVLRRGSAVTTE